MNPNRPGWRAFVSKHRWLLLLIAAAIGLYVAATLWAARSSVFGGEHGSLKDAADQIKVWMLGFGTLAPLVFILLQMAQVVIAPIPGQAMGFAGGYIFGWKLGLAFGLAGQAIGSIIVFCAARLLGRAFVEKLHAKAALADLEAMLIPKESPRNRLYDKSKQGLRRHGLATFFFIMLFPALPDDVACFVAGLTTIPIWQLTLAAVAGRLPGLAALCLVGDGVSHAHGNKLLYTMIGLSCVFTAVYFWQRPRIEVFFRRLSGARIAESTQEPADAEGLGASAAADDHDP